MNFIPVQVCFFSCVESYVMFWQKQVSEQGIIPLKAERSARQAKYFAAGDKVKKLLFLLSEISKPNRHSINYSPSLHQSDNLIMTAGGYGVSVRLQSRHDRGSNCNMFAAKKYGPL